MTAEALRDILDAARTIAVVGLSPRSLRPSHGVARYLQDAGYRIVPVNPGHTTILGERSYPTLTAAAAAWSRCAPCTDRRVVPPSSGSSLAATCGRSASTPT